MVMGAGGIACGELAVLQELVVELEVEVVVVVAGFLLD